MATAEASEFDQFGEEQYDDEFDYHHRIYEAMEMGEGCEPCKAVATIMADLVAAHDDTKQELVRVKERLSALETTAKRHGMDEKRNEYRILVADAISCVFDRIWIEIRAQFPPNSRITKVNFFAEVEEGFEDTIDILNQALAAVSIPRIEYDALVAAKRARNEKSHFSKKPGELLAQLKKIKPPNDFVNVWYILISKSDVWATV